MARLATGGASGAYRLAGRPVTTHPRLLTLEAFAVEGLAAEPPVQGPRSSAVETRAAGREIASVQGIVADRERLVTSFRTGAGYRIRIEEIGEYSLVEADPWLEIVTEVAASPLGVSALLGPVTSLALALDGTWMLHASAVGHRAWGPAVFVGPGGAGKSTLARYLASAGGEWQALSDDVLPVELREGGGLTVLPWYPQPRWAPDEQAGSGHPERLEVSALFVVGRPAGAQSGVGVERLGARQAALAIIQQTVAGSLFDDELLERHLAFAGSLAEALPVYRLVYPLRMDLLPEVASRVAEILERSGARGRDS